MGVIKARLNAHFINQHQDTRWTFGAQKLFGINPLAFSLSPFIPLHFLLAQSPAGVRAINQIFQLKFKEMKAQNLNPLFQVSEIKVSYHPKFRASERPMVSTSRQAYDVLTNNWDLDRINFQQQFYILLLNTACKVIGISQIAAGGKAVTVADPKLIFSVALKGQATSIILAHNHPSETLKPSEADINLTRKMVEVGKLLELHV